jgi:hypothetical protein
VSSSVVVGKDKNKGGRCIVPASAFAEPDRNTASPVLNRWFVRADGLPFFFAGIWREWLGDRGTEKEPNVGLHQLYAFLTTEPNRPASCACSRCSSPDVPSAFLVERRPIVAEASRITWSLDRRQEFSNVPEKRSCRFASLVHSHQLFSLARRPSSDEYDPSSPQPCGHKRFSKRYVSQGSRHRQSLLTKSTTKL